MSLLRRPGYQLITKVCHNQVTHISITRCSSRLTYNWLWQWYHVGLIAYLDRKQGISTPSQATNLLIILLLGHALPPIDSSHINLFRCIFLWFHDDVIKWKHFQRYWPFVQGIHRWSVNSLYKGQWRGALMFSFICAWINGWVNNREAGDLRRHRTHYKSLLCPSG